MSIIKASQDVLSGVYSVMNQRRGIITQEVPLPHSPLVRLQALIPVDESMGLQSALRASTGGRGESQLSFSHWELVPGSPLEKGARACDMCLKMRIRKKLGQQM